MIISAVILFSCSEKSSNTTDPSKKATITSLTPQPIDIGGIITIKGTNFGANRDTSYVSFAGTQATDYSSWSDTEIIVKVPAGAKTGKLWVVVDGEKSNDLEFILKSVNPGDFETVTIGTQVWMRKNLDVTTYRNGDPIPEVTDPTKWENLTTGAWCYYNNDPANGEIYGKLYNWYAVNDPRGLAPHGWHVATDAEWKILTNYLGGLSVAGGKLKEAGTVHWDFPNEGATNESGFSALPGGSRSYDYGIFISIGNGGNWWSATEYVAKFAWARHIFHDYASISGYTNGKEHGFSVRCVRD